MKYRTYDGGDAESEELHVLIYRHNGYLGAVCFVCDEAKDMDYPTDVATIVRIVEQLSEVVPEDVEMSNVTIRWDVEDMSEIPVVDLYDKDNEDEKPKKTGGRS